ncbi:hypothetical protein BMF94_0925 [Rhodotorula taiwanensis]|uniref:Phospholipid/glycerol acyltransferase domain-containing protein n=1 Tax=Rhodotorula taiwanensis TaxID=741276 RepID=A0A2S5BGE8_9BASI|nr:hypothetical protein BMF94_0925 [Rhodotorula taiwanensis]
MLAGSRTLQRPPLWSIPVSDRPYSSLWLTLPLSIAFVTVFDVGLLATFFLLVLLYPLSFSAATRRRYRHLGKAAFGRLLVVIVEWFSPTDLVLTAGQGIDAERWIERDGEGHVQALRLPDKALWISNHTTLTDWIYLWNVAYLSRGHSASLYISLKSSLRKVPLIGWAASEFGFVYLARKWATDKEPFARQLHAIAKENAREGQKMAVLLFPEGTIVTDNTRQGSANLHRGCSSCHGRLTWILTVADLKHLLLPRSTGLFFALRQFARTTPSLELVDFTVGYPLPRQAPSRQTTPLYASDFYTLPSILLSHVPPPELHVHVRSFKLDAIPLGELKPAANGEGVDEGKPEEKEAFERWLSERWLEKDGLMERFRTEGTFVAPDSVNGSSARADDSSDDGEDERRGEYRWPVRLRQPRWELPAAFQFGWPIIVAALIWYQRHILINSLYVVFGLGHGHRIAQLDKIEL